MVSVNSGTQLWCFERHNRERKEEVDTESVQDNGRCRNDNPSDLPNTGPGGRLELLSLSENSPFLQGTVFPLEEWTHLE